jgi:NACalpha-BTF3-like transcription factor
MSAQKTTKVVHVMGVKIDPDGSIEEFIIPRHRLKLSVFAPKVVMEGVCDIVEGEGAISLLA